MKKYFRYAILSLGVLTATSCEKFLEKTPYDVLPSDYYKTQDELTAGIAGVYDVLGSIYGSNWLFAMGHEADEGFYERDNRPIGPQNFNFSASHSYVASTWSALYRGIYRANYLLANINKNESIPTAFRDRIRGEALFLRGHYYSVLVHLFGGVPLILKPTTDGAANMDVPRSSIAEVYEQILTDLKTAEDLVPSITVSGGGRASKSAVRGMLARVCLYMAGYPLRDVSKYAEAKSWAKKVIDDTAAGHALNPDFKNIFIKYARDEYDIKESIFEVEFWGNRTDNYTETGAVGFSNGPFSSNDNTGRGFGGLKVTAKLYRAYLGAGDLRRDWTIANFTYSSSGVSGAKSMLTENPADGTIYNREVAKWRREFEVLLPKSNAATPQNFPLLRYSDILLMFAEADYEMNPGVPPSEEAKKYVNEVRRRAWSTGIKTVKIENGGSGYTSAPSVTFTGGGGTGAVATATVSGGKVTGLVFSRDAGVGARGTGYTSPPTITFTGGGGTGAIAVAEIYKKEEAELTNAEIEDFLKAIQDERMREFAFEQMRKADLIRWGIFIPEMRKVLTMMDTNPPDATNLHSRERFANSLYSRHLIWPIPSVEIMMNRAIVQNPNW